jgi:hypothetical protein
MPDRTQRLADLLRRQFIVSDETAKKWEVPEDECVEEAKEILDMLGMTDLERDELAAQVGELREYLEEAALPPYADSDRESLARTLRIRAAALLATTPSAALARLTRREWERGMEDAAGMCHERALSYHSQMEGQGMPEFGALEFAMVGMGVIEGDIRARIKEEK